MTQYYEISFGISPKQRKSIASAVSAGSGVNLKLSNAQLHENSATILATASQYKKIQKARSNGTGVMISISKKQLDKMKSGGFLPVVLGALVSSLAPVLFNKIFPSKNDPEGEGIYIPGGRGNYGMGIRPDNGGSTSYRIENFSAGNAGNGIVVPGTRAARTRYPGQQNAMGVERFQRGKKKTMRRKPRIGYLQPNIEEDFQMLE